MSLKINTDHILRDAQKLQQLGNYEKAIVKYLEVLKYDNSNYNAYNNLSVIYINQAKLDLAEKLIMQFLSLGDGDASSFNHLAIVYMRTSRVREAIGLLEHALTLDPFKFETYLNLTNACGVLKLSDKALKYALEAVKIMPTSSPAFNNLGSVLNSMAMFDEAEIAFHAAIEIDSSNLEAFVNLASAESRKLNFNNAAKLFEKALKKLPKQAKSQSDVIKFLCSFEYFRIGNISKAVDYYDGGFHPNIPGDSKRSPQRTFEVPLWDGKIRTDKCILIWREQGLGDELMFFSILPDVANHTKNIIIEVDYRLVDIFKRSFPGIKVREQNFGGPPKFKSNYNDFDFHIPVGSLMKYYRRSINSFKNSGPYLIVDSDKKIKFKDRLSIYKDKLLIGICWRSGTVDHLRALTYVGIMKWGELFALENVTWVNLQYGECEEECLAAEKEFGIEIIRWNDLDLKDHLDDVFALMSELDYVVTVATAVHHMAASIGCETLLITPKGGWNRFNLDYDPWFPNIHPFVADYQNLHESLSIVRDYIIEKEKHGPVRKLKLA